MPDPSVTGRRALFVTGTGTDIGKTHVVGRLIRELRAQGRAVTALKPVMSGYNESRPFECDVAEYLRAQGQEVKAQTIAALAPFRFRAALSPDMAARLEGRSLDFEALVKFTRDAIAQTPHALLIEGVGGVMVPLTRRHTVRDWIAACAVPALLVTGSYLGSLSHCLTAMEVLQMAHIKVVGIVVSESEDSPVDLEATRRSLEQFLPDIPLLILPRGRDPIVPLLSVCPELLTL
jgi:dethiobiotin synthetase